MHLQMVLRRAKAKPDRAFRDARDYTSFSICGKADMKLKPDAQVLAHGPHGGGPDKGYIILIFVIN